RTISIPVVSGHKAILRLKRYGIDALPVPLRRRVRETGLVPDDQQRAFGRIAIHPPGAILLAQAGIVAEHPRPQPQGKRRLALGVDDATIQAEVADRLVTRPAHIENMTGTDDALHRHLVPGQRAGLVGTDHGDGSKSLDRREAPDDGVAPGHAL